jgi:solute carrier family 25 iron transporter 28/37
VADLVDTIRTLQQTSTNFSYRLPFVRYWRGLGTSVVLSAPAFTVYMVSYRQTKRELVPYFGENAMPNFVLSASVAEFFSSIIWTPLEVLKGRLQVIESRRFESLSRLASTIYHTEGIKGFYRGYWMGIFVFLPYSVVWWSFYEHAKKYLCNSENPGLIRYATASALSTTVACTATNFLEVVKVRQQLAPAAEITHMRPDDQKSLIKVARNLIKEVGFLRAMVKGLHVHLLHSLPTAVLGMVIVEAIEPDNAARTETEALV